MISSRKSILGLQKPPLNTSSCTLHIQMKMCLFAYNSRTNEIICTKLCLFLETKLRVRVQIRAVPVAPKVRQKNDAKTKAVC